MRKEDLSVPALLLEAVTIVLCLCDIGLQIYYGVRFHIPLLHYLWNILALLLVYAALLLLEIFPEKVNRMTPQMFTAPIRRYTLRMLRLIKFVFVTGMFVPSVFDAFGRSIMDAASLTVALLIILIAVYYEYRVYQELQKNKDK